MRERHERLVRDSLEASIAAKRAFAEAASGLLIEAAQAVAERLRAGGKVLCFGNGGSAAEAQNFASELVNRMERERPGIAALALTTDASVLTSIANDYAYERVFARQVETLASRGDVALAISTSGNSPNVVAALGAAEAAGLLTVGFLGRDGGKCRALCRFPLMVPARSTQRIQEVHILMSHLLAEMIEDHLHPR